MRLLQNLGIYDAYLERLNNLTDSQDGYDKRISAIIEDRYAASHILKPVLDGDLNAMLTLGLDRASQISWAKKQGSSERRLDKILLAQIENHKADVFYNLDPVSFDDSFVSKLPGCVKKVIGWRASPSLNTNFFLYDKIISNFSGILNRYSELGIRTAYFSPAHDPEMDSYIGNGNRDIDVIFIGSYSPHHRARNKLLEVVAQYSKSLNIEIFLNRSRITKLANHFLIPDILLKKNKIPTQIKNIAKAPIFGRQIYEMIGRSKVVFNAGIDMSKAERGNMRCFEAMGCGALLLTDRGIYPRGMEDGYSCKLYEDVESLRIFLNELKAGEWEKYRDIATRGNRMIKKIYSKEIQSKNFMKLLN